MLVSCCAAGCVACASPFCTASLWSWCGLFLSTLPLSHAHDIRKRHCHCCLLLLLLPVKMSQTDLKERKSLPSLSSLLNSCNPITCKKVPQAGRGRCCRLYLHSGLQQQLTGEGGKEIGKGKKWQTSELTLKLLSLMLMAGSLPPAMTETSR